MCEAYMVFFQCYSNILYKKDLILSNLLFLVLYCFENNKLSLLEIFMNQTLLAQKMGISKIVFGNKLNDSLFSDDELIRLKMILRELYSDLDGVIDIDFNDILKSII